MSVFIVPYGLHAHFFTEDEIVGQREVHSLRSLPVRIEGSASTDSKSDSRSSALGSAWYEEPIMACIMWIESILG